MKDNIYSVEKINDETFLIDEFGRDICYLLLGEKSALLIDCSIGLGDLKGVVSELTDLPVTVAATHSHADHIGGAYQFGSVWVHKKDKGIVPRFLATNLFRARLLSHKMKQNGIDKSYVHGHPSLCRWRSFSDGKVFDLGGRKITAHHTPGHSKGSVVFTDDKYKLMFTGDNTCPYLLMKVPGSVSLTKWLDGAEKTLELSKTYTPYCAHGNGRQSTQQIQNTIDRVKEIIEAEKGKKRPLRSEKKIYPLKAKTECVVYDTRKI